MITSTLYPSDNYEPIDPKFGMGHYVPELTNHAKFSCDQISGGAPHVIVIFRGCVTFINIFLFFLFLATRTAQTREPIFTHNSLKDAF